MPPHPHEWTPQDKVLVANALARAARDDDVDEAHALILLDGIADEQDLPAAELLLQDGPEWEFR